MVATESDLSVYLSCLVSIAYPHIHQFEAPSHRKIPYTFNAGYL